jgi:hypothetical protein
MFVETDARRVVDAKSRMSWVIIIFPRAISNNEHNKLVLQVAIGMPAFAGDLRLQLFKAASVNTAVNNLPIAEPGSRTWPSA